MPERYGLVTGGEQGNLDYLWVAALSVRPVTSPRSARLCVQKDPSFWTRVWTSAIFFFLARPPVLV